MAPLNPSSETLQIGIGYTLEDRRAQTLSFVFLKPCLPLRNVGGRVVGVRKIRDNVSPGDSPDFL
jgi:hypothetical protein